MFLNKIFIAGLESYIDGEAYALRTCFSSWYG